MKRSIAPPCQVRHSPPTALTMPRLAVTDRARPAEREHELADARRAVGRGGGGRAGAVREAEHGEIGRRIASGQRGGGGGAVVQRDGDVVVPLNGVMRRDDDARLPDDAGGRDPAAGVDGDDRPADGVDRGGEII